MITMIAESIGMVLVVLFMQFIGKIGYDIFFFLSRDPETGKRYNAHIALFSGDNPAVGISFIGYQIALYLGTISGYGAMTGDFVERAGTVLVHGFVTMFLLMASWIVNDRFVLRKVRNAHAVFGKALLSVGIVEAATYVATSWVLSSAWTNGGWGAVLTWFVIGQVIVCLCALLYEAVNPVKVFEQIEERANPVVAIALGGFLFAVANIVHRAILGPAGHLGEDLFDVIVYVGVGIAFLAAARFVLGKLPLDLGVNGDDKKKIGTLDEESVIQRNWNAGLIEGVMYVLVSAAFTALA